MGSALSRLARSPCASRRLPWLPPSVPRPVPPSGHPLVTSHVRRRAAAM